MRILLLFVSLAAVWLIVDRWYMIAPAEQGGPVRAKVVKCELPLPSDQAAMIFASYYNSAAVSPVRLGAGAQADRTSALKVTIERGFKPLYIVVAGSRHSVLDVSGWTRRVELLVVVTSAEFPIAVRGLPASRVLFADNRSCSGTSPLDRVYDAEAVHQDLSWLAAVVRRPLKPSDKRKAGSAGQDEYRMPDAVGGAYSPAELHISSSAVTPTEYAPHTHGPVPEWFNDASEAADFYPAGVGDFGLAGIITPVSAELYRVLPDRAGIAQLIRDGKMSGQYGGEYRILAPLELPEGLCGSMSAHFTLAPGVPRPTGDLCHSSIR